MDEVLRQRACRNLALRPAGTARPARQARGDQADRGTGLLPDQRHPFPAAGTDSRTDHRPGHHRRRRLRHLGCRQGSQAAPAGQRAVQFDERLRGGRDAPSCARDPAESQPARRHRPDRQLHPDARPDVARHPRGGHGPDQRGRCG
ncbi:hypothetical protein SDC9_150192 [bioreactor metagenome]|uniref:Uncharacterized protein n=1 Tax=bioreactor metagenome TaxID=1076179 RepID=A0A645ELT7_9ZZZZ